MKTKPDRIPTRLRSAEGKRRRRARRKERRALAVSLEAQHEGLKREASRQASVISASLSHPDVPPEEVRAELRSRGKVLAAAKKRVRARLFGARWNPLDKG